MINNSHLHLSLLARFHAHHLLVYILLLLLINPDDIFSQSGWQWLNPLPQGNPLTSISYLDSSIILIVGEAGTILRSTDAGETWALNQTVTQKNLLAVVALDSVTALAAGDSGTIIKTTNRGESWTHLYSGTPKRLTGIATVNSSICYASGFNGTLLMTTNGGSSWVGKNTGTSNNLHDVHFANASFGVVVGDSGTIRKTTNGGTTWSNWSLYPDITLLKVHFLSPMIGWVLGYDFGNGFLLKTTVGGTWQWMVGSSLYGLYGLSVLDTNFVSTSGGGGNEANSYVFTSTNGGNNWLYKTPMQGGDIVEVCFRDPQNGIAVGLLGRILKTTDGGNSWSEKSVGSRPTFNSLYAFDDRQLIVVGDSGLVYQTTDGGTTWILNYLMGSNGRAYFMHINFLHHLLGVAIGYFGPVFRTSNGGGNWIAQPIGGTVYLHEVAFLDSSVLVAAGQNIIYRSSDSGINWQPQYINLTHSFYGISLINSLKTISVGQSGIIVISSDAGISWNQQNSGVTSNLNSISIVDSITFHTVGTSGTILKTTDGGLNWSLQQSYVVNELRSVFFINHDTGYVAGTGGLILRTTNGGTSWTRQMSGTNNDLNAIFFVNATTGFVVGANGTILKTTDGGVPVELLSFTASLVGDDRVDLFWSTASETNNYGFEIERRTITNNPQGSWERIGFVTGRGTTTNPQAYSFTDGIGLQSAIRNLKSVQYRLKQIDNDGRYEYSQIVALHFPMLNAISLDQNYPNPVITSSFYSNALSTVRFTLNTSAHVSLIIMDQHGRQLKTLLDENRSSGPHYITFDASKFPSGIYFYRLRASGKEIIKKMVVH